MVRIASIRLKGYRRTFRRPLVRAKDTLSVRTGFLVRITGNNGLAGFGEVGTPLEMERYLGSDHVDALDLLQEEFSKRIAGRPIPKTLDELQTLLEINIPDVPNDIQFGIETALADLAARTAGKPLCRWLRAKTRSRISVNYLVDRPVTDWESLGSFIAEAGYRAVKVKVGAGPIDDDLRFVAQLRKKLGDAVTIRIDANRAWTYDAARDTMIRLRRLNIEYVEEPLGQCDLESLKRLRDVTGVKVALDESIKSMWDAQRALEAEACDVLVIKPAVIGGLHATLELLKLGRKLGCTVVVTTNLETEIGVAAHLHLAACLPGEIPPCGLDTLRLFEEAEASLTHVIDGAIALPEGPGIGFGDSLWKKL